MNPPRTGNISPIGPSFPCSGLCGTYIANVTAQVTDSDGSAVMGGTSQGMVQLMSGLGGGLQWSGLSFSGLSLTPPGDFYILVVTFFESDNFPTTVMSMRINVTEPMH